MNVLRLISKIKDTIVSNVVNGGAFPQKKLVNELENLESVLSKVKESLSPENQHYISRTINAILTNLKTAEQNDTDTRMRDLSIFEDMSFKLLEIFNEGQISIHELGLYVKTVQCSNGDSCRYREICKYLH